MTGTPKRVLIVEDHPDVLETYKKNVIRAGFEVDTAITKEEALEKVRRRSYHVAMIDVNLTDHSGGDGQDRSGIEIVRQIKSQGEGTKCIVISGEKSSEVPVDAEEAGHDKYLIKKRIRGPDDYIGHVKQLAAECVLQTTGRRFADLIAYLAFPEKRWSWEGDFMRILKCDAAGISKTLNDIFSTYLPVLRQKDNNFSLSPAMDSRVLAGFFWSKGIGQPIWVVLGPKGVELPKSDAKGAELLDSRTKGPIQHAIWDIGHLSRSDFFESADDLR